MKAIYKGYELVVNSDTCQGGWRQLVFAIFRVRDGREMYSGFSGGTDTVKRMLEELKLRVDAELASPTPWGAE